MFVDTHCHLADKRYGDISPEEIIEDCQTQGVIPINNGCGLKDSERGIDLVHNNEHVYTCVGITYDSRRVNLQKAKQRLMGLCRKNKVVGIGETGLNYFQGMSESLREWQTELFKMQLEVAEATGLPVQIHNRNADEDILKISDKYKVRGTMHCFSGTDEFMRKCVDRGWYIGIGGMATFKSRGELRKVIDNIPNKNLLLETDAPYLAPEPVRGSLNYPKNVKIVAEQVASIKNTSIEEIEEITTQNAKRLFFDANISYE